MKPFLLLMTMGLVVLATESCTTGSAKEKTPRYEAPKALQDENKMDVSIETKRSFRNDIVEDLYQELLEKDPALRKLEEDIKRTDKEYDTANEKFEEYNRKSFNYYSDAGLKLRSINDSTIKKRIADILENSKKIYESKTGHVKNLLKYAEVKSISKNDYYLLLKIIKTLPEIEKYQTQAIPDKKTTETIISHYNKIITKAETLSRNE